MFRAFTGRGFQSQTSNPEQIKVCSCLLDRPVSISRPYIQGSLKSTFIYSIANETIYTVSKDKLKMILYI